MEHEEMIDRTRRSFDRLLGSEQYTALLRDDEHLALLLNLADVHEGTRVLDLGTGAGYVAIAVARSCPGCCVTGLDIASAERARAAAAALPNIAFDVYDGLHLPYPDASFDLILTRYALHHFPDTSAAAAEMARVLRPGGRAIIADPMRHPADRLRIIDRFMAVKDDGHAGFRTPEELDACFAPCGMARTDTVLTAMKFPFPPRADYLALLDTCSESDRALYDLHAENGVVRVGCIAVGNLVYRKSCDSLFVGWTISPLTWYDEGAAGELRSS